MTLKFHEGDKLCNPARPEWGIGTIIDIEVYPGQRVQRIRINFAGAGVKTMAVPPAKLVSPNTKKAAEGQTKQDLDPNTTNVDLLTILPDIVTDRLAETEARLAEFARLYRFSDTPRDIFDWAVMLTGSPDPLQAFTADELAAHHSLFARRRDGALRELRRQTGKEGGEEHLIELIRKIRDERVRTRILTVLDRR